MTVLAESAEYAVTHLLLVSEDNGAINRLISQLRNEGMSLRPAITGTEKELASLLTQDQWDVLVIYDHAKIKLNSLIALLKKHEQDIPIILVSDKTDADLKSLELYKLGVRDIVSAAENEHLIVSILREAEQYALRKQLRLQEIRQRELEQRHQLLLADSSTAVSYIRDGIHLYCNQSYADIFAYSSIDSISTTPLLNLIVKTDRPKLKALLSKAEVAAQSDNILVCQQDGTEEELQLNFSPVEFQGKPCLQMTAHYPSGNAQHSAQVAKLNSQDLLTKLHNRSHFLNRIEAAIRAAIQKGDFSCLIVLELNDFEDIAATIGRSSSNLVLNDIANYIQSALDQPMTAGRLDQHEFGIIIYNGDPDEAFALCRKIQEKINNRISSAMLSSLELSCSIGMALINGHALNAQDLLDRAHQNMEQDNSTALSKNVFRINDSLQHDANDMLEYLTSAIAEKRFKLVFQPIVGISGNNRHFYEVLIRMLDQDDNEIMPGSFLPLANLNGMGEQIDRMVTSMALESLAKSDAVQQLTVNITSNTLMSATFLPWLSEQLIATRIAADRLMIDLSEISIHSAQEQALDFCKGLHELGIRLTISHFGCALKPFDILDQIKPELVTLDETVVRDLIYSSHQKSNVQAMVKTLHAKKLLVVTPRVEDMAVLPVLWGIGVDFVQGYCVQAPSNEMNYEFVQDEEITLTAPSQ